MNETNRADDLNAVPIERKLALTIREAAEYSNIGQNRIEKLLKAPHCPFVLFVGSKKLVKRKEFGQFISEKNRNLTKRNVPCVKDQSVCGCESGEQGPRQSNHLGQ